MCNNCIPEEGKYLNINYIYTYSKVNIYSSTIRFLQRCW